MSVIVSAERTETKPREEQGKVKEESREAKKGRKKAEQ